MVRRPGRGRLRQPPSPLLACSLPLFSSADQSDCDDGRVDVHPGATERCDALDVDEDCDGSAEEVGAEGATIWYDDLDGDGYGAIATSGCGEAGQIPNGGDCDDASAAVSPDADERCGVGDEDCDGDEELGAVDALTWYADADGDGYGGVETLDACSQPPGYVSGGGALDCDEGDAAVGPGAAEYCDGVDQDCDGATDEDAVDRVSLSVDADVDGHGAADALVLACPAEPGLADNADDCDDADPQVNPDAEELAGDLVDNNCDGLALLAGELSPGQAALRLDGPNSWARAGDALGAPGDVDGDGVVDLLVGAPDSDQAWLVYGGSGLGSAELGVSAGHTHLSGGLSSSVALGTSFVEAGDVDGDSLGDVLVGAPLSSEGGFANSREMGAAWLFFGADLARGGSVDGTSALRLVGECGYAGSVVARLSDVAGGLIYPVGAPSCGNSQAGRVHLVDETSLASLGGGDRVNLGLSVTLEGEAGSRFGAALAAFDLYGDGVDALAVGAYQASPTTLTQAGRVYLFDDPAGLSADGTGVDLSTWILEGEAARDFVGGALANAGDVNGDGYEDLLVGATGVDDVVGGATVVNVGAVWLLDGALLAASAPAPGDRPLTAPISSVGAKFIGTDGVLELAPVGAALSGGQDVDGDGFAEFFVASPSRNTAFLVYGGTYSGEYVLVDTAHAVFSDSTGFSTFGQVIMSPGDLSDDGVPDVLVSDDTLVPDTVSTGQSYGAIYAFWGGTL